MELQVRAVTQIEESKMREIQLNAEIQYRVREMKEKLQMRREVFQEEVDIIYRLQNELVQLG